MNQLLRFSLIGVINTMIHFGVFMVLFAGLGWHHLAASLVGFLAAVVNSYAMNKFWTFAVRGTRVLPELARFFIVSVLALIVNLAGMALLVDGLALYPPAAQLVSIVAALLINFLGNKHWSFRQPA